MKSVSAVLLGCVLVACGPSLDLEDAIQHLSENRDGFEAARADVLSLLPPDHRVQIGIADDGLIDLKAYGPSDSGQPGSNSIIEWSVAEDGPEVARGLALLGWSLSDFRRVRDHIAALDGIGLSAPTQGNGIGLLYRRADDGRYTFFVGGSPLASQEQLGWNGCESYWLDQRAGLVFDGGAIGPICMPGGEVTARY